MTQLTNILQAMDRGDPRAADQLLPLVYDELRKLASQRLAQEKPGQTLEATALVHEAYLRLAAGPGQESGENAQSWDSRGHFFAAAAEAMRRILVESARRKNRIKHGGGRIRIDIEAMAQITEEPPDNLLDLDEALHKLEHVDAEAAQVIKLRYFAGLTMQQTAQALRLSLRTTERNDTFARTWLHRELDRAVAKEASTS